MAKSVGILIGAPAHARMADIIERLLVKFAILEGKPDIGCSQRRCAMNGIGDRETAFVAFIGGGIVMPQYYFALASLGGALGLGGCGNFPDAERLWVFQEKRSGSDFR